MEAIWGWLKEILVELLAGLFGAAIVWVLAKMGPKRLQQWANKLRRVVWPLLAFMFLAIALTIAIRWPPPRPIVVTLGTILVLVLASFIPPRFVPVKISHLRDTIRAYVWSILTGLFVLSTVALIIIIIIWPPPPAPPPPPPARRKRLG